MQFQEFLAVKPNKYKGVSFNKKAQKWYAQICINKKIIYVGSFDSEVIAHEARLAYIAEHSILEYKPSGITPAELKKKWNQNNKDKVANYNKTYRDANKELSYPKEQKYRRDLKQSIIDAYGGCCAACGEKTMELLTIDHINNNGALHRKEIGGGGLMTYRWLKKNGFPKDDYQILCWNCNCSKHFYGESAKSSKTY